MVPEDKVDTVKVGTPVQLEQEAADPAKETYGNIIVPPEKRSGNFGSMQDTLHAVNDAAQTAIQSQQIRPETQLDAKVGMSTNPSMSLGALFSNSHPTLIVQFDERTSEFYAVGIPTKKQQTEDAIKLATVEAELISVRGKLVEKQAQVKVECDKKLKLEETFDALKCQKRKVDDDLLVMKGKADNCRKSQLELKRKMEEAQKACETVRGAYKRHSGRLAASNREKQGELLQMRKEKIQMISSLETICKELEEEKEKNLCHICLDSPKDAICFPCRHLHYCSPCLEKHQKQINSCPTCREPILTVFKCIM